MGPACSFQGLNWLLIHPTTLVVNGLSVKLIQSAPILLTFGCVHEGAAFTDISVVVTLNHSYQYCSGKDGGTKERNKGRQKGRKKEKMKIKKILIQVKMGAIGPWGQYRWPWVGNQKSGLNGGLSACLITHFWGSITSLGVSALCKK